MLSVERRHGVMWLHSDGPIAHEQERMVMDAVESIVFSTDNKCIIIDDGGRRAKEVVVVDE